MKKVAFFLLIIAALITIWLIFWGGFWGNTAIPDPDKARNLQPFMTGLVAPLLTVASILFVIENLMMTTRQNFSNNFFKLLDFHHKIVDGISDIVYGINDKAKAVPDEIPTIKIQNEEVKVLYEDLFKSSSKSNQSKPDKSQKRFFFSDLSWRICYDYNNIDNEGKELENNYKTKLEIYDEVKEKVKGKSPKDKLTAIYVYYYDIHREILSQYMQHLEAIINYIDKYGMNEDIKKEHFGLLAAQLSNYELAVIAYHYLVETRKDFKEKVDRIQLLRMADFEEGQSEEYHKRFAAPDVIKAAYPLTFQTA